MTVFDNAFYDELEKVAKYGISRVLSHAAPMGLAEGVSAAALTHNPFIALAGGAKGVAEGSLARRIFGRGLAGRIARGGKGMTKQEIKRLAEGLHVSEKELLHAIKSKAGKGLPTMPVSRALSTKYNPLNIPDRFIRARGMAGNMLAGNKHMTKRELEIVEDLRKTVHRRRLGRIGAGAGAGAGYGAYRHHKAK